MVNDEDATVDQLLDRITVTISIISESIKSLEDVRVDLKKLDAHHEIYHPECNFGNDWG